MSGDLCTLGSVYSAPYARRDLFFVIPVSSPVATFEQSENVAIAHLAGGVWPLQPLPSAHAHGTNGLCMYDHAC